MTKQFQLELNKLCKKHNQMLVVQSVPVSNPLERYPAPKGYYVEDYFVTLSKDKSNKKFNKR